MALYESQRYPFSLQYPYHWADLGAQPELGVVAQYGNENAILSVSEEDLAALGLSGTTLSDYTDLIVSTLEAFTLDFSLLSQRRVTTAAGLEVMVIEYTIASGSYQAARVIYVHEGRIGFSATYAALAQDFEQLEKTFNYSFSTFRVTGEE
jgi:hypothetical protein